MGHGFGYHVPISSDDDEESAAAGGAVSKHGDAHLSGAEEDDDDNLEVSSVEGEARLSKRSSAGRDSLRVNKER